ncbi:MAG: hypothetical protein RL376_1080 [Verrucomicrobiota bacterium]|jgi:hypothetical protein
MIVTRLSGGLGNQLFQYAAGYATAHRLGVPLTFDFEPLHLLSGQAPALASLGVRLPEATSAELASVAPRWAGPIHNKLLLWRHRFTPYSRRRWVREKSYDYDPRFHHIRSPAYLDGYWQSERYFSSVADTLRPRLQPRAPDAETENLGAQLARQPTLAIHVRRGDYLTDSHAARFHGCCPIDYYHRAADLLSHRIPITHYVLFSDDPEWARNHIPPPAPGAVLIPTGPRSALADFYLLTRCTHFIIANSSFSWWTAWLAQSPGQQVIAPRRWFLGHDVNPADRFPAAWTPLV